MEELVVQTTARRRTGTAASRRSPTRCGAADDARVAEVDAHVDQVLGGLAARVQAFVLHAAAERRATGQLEFHDLLVLSRDVLRSHPDVRRRLAEAHRYLLVDEFQDTDPLQLEIASLIAAAEGEIGRMGRAGGVAGSDLLRR